MGEKYGGRVRVPCSRRRWCAVLTAGALGVYLVAQLAIDSPAREALARPLPLYLKLHKTGGTSVAAALARVVLNEDAAYGTWRARLDGRKAPPGSGGDASLAALVPSLAFQKLGKFCGNYDGHWATQAYRVFGESGMARCGGVPWRPNAKLVTLLRDPAPRFISRLYYELGGATDLLLAPPFASNASSWTPTDVRRMERISCRACVLINGGHCQWRGGLCDSPQEYAVVLGRLGYYGRRGVLQRSGGAVDAPDPHISPPTKDLKGLRRVRAAAEKALREEFAVIGVLEDLPTFLTLLALDLGWALDNFVYATRKSHAVHGASRAHPCARAPAPRTELIQGRLGDRRDERLAKRADAKAHHNASVVAWSGVWPLLGWNAPRKGKLRPETRQYVERRNADDTHLWALARELAEARLAAAPGGPDARRRLGALQAAYAGGIVRDAQGFYAPCDWRVKDHERAAAGGAAPDLNAACLRCAAALPRRRCRVDGVEATCRADVDPGDVGFSLVYEE